MAISRKHKAAIIRGLIVTKQKSHLLELDLKFAAKFADARDQAESSKRLSRQIDRLLGQAMDAWSGRGKTTVTNIKTANASLQRAIREIGKDIRTAQNIVKALGLVDDVVAIAAKLAAAAG